MIRIIVTIICFLFMSFRFDACNHKVYSVEEDNRDEYYEPAIETTTEELYTKTTGTERTNAIEQLLHEKYGIDFVCEQYLYYLEYSLLCDLTAYPVGHPELEFELDIYHEDPIELWYDKYFNVLYRDEISNFVYEAVKSYGIPRENFFVDYLYMITTPTISEETFKETDDFSVYIMVPREQQAEIDASMKDIITSIAHRVNSQKDFFIYVCDESMTVPYENQYVSVLSIYDVDYADCYYKVFYGVPGEFWTIR